MVNGFVSAVGCSYESYECVWFRKGESEVGNENSMASILLVHGMDVILIKDIIILTTIAM